MQPVDDHYEFLNIVIYILRSDVNILFCFFYKMSDFSQRFLHILDDHGPAHFILIRFLVRDKTTSKGVTTNRLEFTFFVLELNIYVNHAGFVYFEFNVIRTVVIVYQLERYY